MSRAVCLIRDLPHYRREAFVSGLGAAGFDLCDQLDRPRAGDVLVIWNRYGRFEREAARFEQTGARVIVAENGYCGKDAEGRQLYALSLSDHLGAGQWPKGDGSRWQERKISLAPWQDNAGGHILLCPSRGIGRPGVAQPASWPKAATIEIQKHTRREIRVRAHPGNRAAPVPFEDDLDGAWAVVTWASRCGVDALIAGVPVFHGLRSWILRGAAMSDLSEIERPWRGDRLPSFERLAWAQWTVDEIATGEPFKRLCAL